MFKTRNFVFKMMSFAGRGRLGYCAAGGPRDRTGGQEGEDCGGNDAAEAGGSAIWVKIDEFCITNDMNFVLKMTI